MGWCDADEEPAASGRGDPRGGAAAARTVDHHGGRDPRRAAGDAVRSCQRQDRGLGRDGAAPGEGVRGEHGPLAAHAGRLRCRPRDSGAAAQKSTSAATGPTPSQRSTHSPAALSRSIQRTAKPARSRARTTASANTAGSRRRLIRPRLRSPGHGLHVQNRSSKATLNKSPVVMLRLPFKVQSTELTTVVEEGDGQCHEDLQRDSSRYYGTSNRPGKASRGSSIAAMRRNARTSAGSKRNRAAGIV